ncbi:non-ribosomal peptide synthetase, siderophore synthesis [Podospora didyma]|uniref:Non-ribosomal peptide synthetase, siderophore synthesis n=1 Tax=Podospora didyma TaxID=330526 RepID=A0AAE0NG72_9PEZI|nr:non-ribosomal peptide synthetase, siderophore synthesis [Podospora didyma]
MSSGCLGSVSLIQSSKQTEINKQISSSNMATIISEQGDMLSIVNHPATRLPGPSLLHLLVQTSSPDNAPAVEFLALDGTRVSLSYSEFHSASDALAAKISALAGAQTSPQPFIVPVLIPQSLELYVTLLAILKAGGAFCALNLDVPFERAKFILNDVSASIVITTSELASKLPSGEDSRGLLIVDNAKSLLELPDTSAASVHCKQPLPTDLAYVMYTSGSTGTPKGVGVSHEAATQSLLAHDHHVPKFSRFLQFAAPTFDVSVFEIFFPFFRGKTLVSCSRPAMLDDLPAVLRKMDVDACELTPTVAGSLLRKRDNAPGLRLLLTIGEMLTKPVVEEFGSSDNRTSILWAMYGPTEAAIHCTLQRAFSSASGIGNIGIPLDSVSAFILHVPEGTGGHNPEFKILARGEVGELAVGGYQLADGYLNRPEQTAAAFINTPYGRIYRTGDKARLLTDGTLECLGRISDGQVKLRGQRMELGEVEHAALRTPGCHGAFAAVINSILVLFCALDESGPNATAIEESCKAWLPGFMIPGDIVLSRDFPRLASGKIDRKRLVADYSDARDQGPQHEHNFKDELEWQLCRFAGEILGIEVHPSQNLLRAGMDSIVAIKFASSLREAGLDVGAIDILASKTISSLHSRIGPKAVHPKPEPRPNGAHIEEAILSESVTRTSLQHHLQNLESVTPCTPLQSSMLAETIANSRAYCNWIELSFPDKYSELAIRSWFFQLASLNELLRVGFVHDQGRFLQVIFRELRESQVIATDRPIREFELSQDEDLLRPFRVQISDTVNEGTRVVVLQLHHAVYDGWSVDMMLSDLQSLAEVAQPKFRPQFREVSGYYQSVSFQKDCDAAREFWAANLVGFQPPSMPTLSPQTLNTSSILTTTLTLDLSPDTVKESLRQFGCGTATIFQGCLAWLWSSLTGSEDVVVGSVTSGRTLPISRIEDIIGPCIATVPIRTNISHARTIRDLLTSLQAVNRAVLPHAMLPLSEIKRAAGIRSGQPIFDVLFVYQESLDIKKKGDGIIKEIGSRDYLETKMLVEIEPTQDNFICRFTFHTDAFPETQVGIFQESIQSLVPHMLAELDSEVSALRKCFPRHLLSVYNEHPKPFSGVPDLAHAVETVAAQFPDKDALCFADHVSRGSVTTTTISFRELNSTANKIAWHLKENGLREGDVAAIVMEKSVLLYAGILAILKVGCAYLPLLPITPTARIQAILEHAGVTICLVDTDVKRTLEKQVQCCLVDLQTLDIHGLPEANLKVKPDPSRASYIIYTSGSTGVPKGVCLTQLNIMSNLDVLSKIYPVKADSKMLQSCSQAFDVSVFEMFFAWTQGMCLCSATHDTLFNDLGRSIRKLKVTHLSMTPTVASLLDPADVPDVEFLVTAGEPMTEVVAHKWAKQLYQGYGPSETTNICSVKKMDSNHNLRHLGWSLENTSTFVLFRDSNDVVPLGCFGELCFSGEQVAQGYLMTPDLTAAKFIDHPAFGRLYRSGDLGRMLPDGSMVIVGRVDDQIKLRGQRVELSEIAATVRQSDAVEDCATLFLRPRNSTSASRVVTFYVPKSRQETRFHPLEICGNLAAEIQSLFRLVISSVPSYMVPTFIIPISSLPVTSSGKLDKERLQKAMDELKQEYLELLSPSSGINNNDDDGEGKQLDIERQIAEVISAVFGVKSITVRRWTPLTTLGLDSLTAIEVSKQLQKALGKRIPISTILQNTSVARLAEVLSEMGITSIPSTERPDFFTRDHTYAIKDRFKRHGKLVEGILPCTPLQEAMLATSVGKKAYLNHMLFRSHADEVDLKKAWIKMIQRHGILRTCFITTEDVQRPIVQVVLKNWQPSWNRFDASQSIDECSSRHVDTLQDAIDSLEPPISFATILQGDDTYISFVCHHALYDGMAIERLLYEVEQTLSASPLPAVPEYNIFLQESLSLPAFTDSFWINHLADYEPKLVSQFETSTKKRVEEVAFTVIGKLGLPMSQIHEHAKQLGISLLSLTQSAWAVVLGCLFRSTDICFGNVVSGRSVPIERIDELVAPCFNTIPFPLVCELLPDTRLDMLVTKLHVQQNRFSKQDATFILDLFSHAMRTCLEFPASQIPIPQTIPIHFRSLLSELPYEITVRTLEPDDQHQKKEDWSTMETSIRTVLSSLSATDLHKIHRRTTIYQLGLDSISAVQVASKLRQQGLVISASDVIDNPSCERLARHLDSLSTASTETEPVYDTAKFKAEVLSQIESHVDLGSVEAILPCTPLQAGMMAHFIKSGGRDYFNYLDFQLEEDISLQKLAEAWRAVCRAHSILRTGFLPVEHSDSTFAMVQCVPDAFPEPLVIVSREQSGRFNVEKWRLGVSHDVLTETYTLPWRVAIVETESAIMMHLAIHHSLYDAHALQVLLGHLANALNGVSQSQPPRTELVIVDILGQAMASAESSETFWRKQAENVVINSFPIMTPLRETRRSILVQSTISSLSFTALQNAVSKSGFSLQVVLQAAWSRILSSYLGESSVVFGVVLSGRTTDATQSAVFPCITTLPVISTNTPSNHDVLSRMLRYNTELYKQQHKPLTRIQHWLGCSNSRLFDTLLVYQKFEIDASLPNPWTITNDLATVDYPVSIEVEPQPEDKLKYQITFYNDILPEEQAILLLKQFDAAVQHLAMEPDGSEEDVLVSSPVLLSILPAEKPELPSPITLLHQFVEAQAVEVPKTTALRFVYGFEGDVPIERQWTYEELDLNGNRVAQMLLPFINAGDIVAVHFDKCPEAFFSILGILKAGCAFVALDPSAPSSRKEFIVKDSGASVLLTTNGKKERLGFSVSVPVLSIGEAALAVESSKAPATSRPIESSDVCYCLYTSGTTGTPKGCEITHDNAVQCMLVFQQLFDGHWDKNSRWLQFASLHFDVSVLEQYWTWSVGITLVAAPLDLILEDLTGTISRLEITHIDLTPSLARLVHPDDVPSLCRGVFITGGESLKQEILDVWGSKAVIYNFYGPTEATIGVTVYPRVPENGRASNIGKQFINVGSYVLKPGTEQPVLRGAVGELCVSGRLVGKGYLKREELTVERFPTLTRFEERVYRTGDLVRVLHNGCFEFLGRADDQVKLRGQRLEIGEINHAIKTGVDGIKDVATLVVRNEKQQKDHLVSFIVADLRRDPTAQLQAFQSREAFELCRRVREACRTKLPGYMVPTYVFQLPYIPLSANHKAEIKDLRNLFGNLTHDQLVSVSSSAESQKPLSHTGIKIATVLASMQSIDWATITPSSSIFELGVDSISVLRFSSALKKAGLSASSPSVILRHPIIDDLAHALETQITSAANASSAAARQVVQACAHRHRSSVCRDLCTAPPQIEYIAPCSPLQQGMISRSATDGAYFNSFRFRLAGSISEVRLREAWQRTVDNLPILRTSFVSTSDGFVQVALRSFELPWIEVGIQPSEKSLEDDLLQRRRSWINRNQESITQPYEVLLSGSGGERLLVLHIFHGLYDANSFELMMKQVISQYLSGGVSPADPGPSFLDALCHGPLQNFGHCKSFWVEHLKTATVRSISTAFSAPTAGAASSCERTVSFGQLDAVRASLGVTHQSVLQAAWVRVLTQQLDADPIIGIVTSGRAIELDGADKVVGPLFNTLPFHAKICPQTSDEPGLSWSSLLRSCHNFNTSVLAFQHVPLRDIQKWSSRRKPLFDTLFSFQRVELDTTADCELWQEVESGHDAVYPLALEATLAPSGVLQLLLVSRWGVVDLPALMDELENALSDMAQNPEGPIWAQKMQVNGTITTKELLSNGSTNGEPKILTPSISEFMWTHEALVIRDEISLLAGTSSEAVAETTSIFELGLDSIDLIKLCARLKQHGMRIKTSQLMKVQTVQGILQIVKEHASSGIPATNGDFKDHNGSLSIVEHVDALGLELGGIETVLPATPLQDSMVAEMVGSDFELYFNHDILELSPHVDVQKLKQAWETVISGSPILRTTFVSIDSSDFDFAYCQVVNKEPSSYVEQREIVLEGLQDIMKVAETAKDRARKGDARSGLLQVVVLPNSIDGRRYLVLSIAHALYDGWSLGFIHKDVEAAYMGEYAPRPSYRSYLEEILSPESGDASSFWSSFLDAASPTMFPERRNHSTDGNSIHRSESLSSIHISRLRFFCKTHAVTLQTLGQACWAALLSARTGSLDVVFGVVLSGRDSEASEPLLFPTMNTVAVRTVLHGTISSWMRYMQDNMTNISQFQHFPLRKAQKLAGAGGPLFNSLFIQQRHVPHSKQGASPLMRSVIGHSSVEYPVCVEMEVSEDNLLWRLACDDKYISQDDIPLLFHQLDAVLGHFLASSETDVLGFSDSQTHVCGLPTVVPDFGHAVPISKTNGSDDSPARVWSAEEARIRDVLAGISGVPAPSILKSHNIYHLGLDSISAIKVSSRLKKEGIQIGFRDLLKSKSISEMAQLATQGQRSTESPVIDGTDQIHNPLLFAEILERVGAAKSLKRAGIDASLLDEVLPASPMQVHMISAWQNSDMEVFFPEFTYIMTGPLDGDGMKLAWEILIKEMPMLRTGFVSTTSEEVPILQIIAPPPVASHQTSSSALKWTGISLTPLTQQYCFMSAEYVESNKWILRLKIHHALYDAISLHVIMNRFVTLCTGEGQVERSSGLASDRSAKWRNILRSQNSQENQAARREFWSHYLSGASSTSLSLDPQQHSSGSRTTLVERPAIDDISSARRVCGAHGFSIQALFFAAFATFLASSMAELGTANLDDVVFGIYVANRADNYELSELPYPTLCLVPLRVRLGRSLSLVDIAVNIQEDLHAISSPTNAGVGLWEIKNWTGVTVDSFVNFLSLPLQSEESADSVKLTHLEESVHDAKDVEHVEHVQPLELLSNPVRHAYPNAVDIEAAIHGDSMTIGVFGSSGKLGEHEPRRIVQFIVETLKRI